MMLQIKQNVLLCLSTLILFACGTGSDVSHKADVSKSKQVEGLTKNDAARKNVQDVIDLHVTDWLKPGHSDSYAAKLHLEYDNSAYAGEMSFDITKANGKKFAPAFYSQFIGCLANDLAKSRGAKSWMYMGLHPENDADPKRSRMFYIILRHTQSIESLQKKFLSPLIASESFFSIDDVKYSGQNCTYYKNNLSI